MSAACYLGIDPGVSGGLAVVMLDELCTFALKDKTPRDVWLWLQEHAPVVELAAIEKVNSSPQMGVKSAFTFGQSYGSLRAFLIALERPIEDVSPVVWRKALGCQAPPRPKGTKLGSKESAAARTERKNLSKAKAQALWPKAKITHAVAEAALLAEYARRKSAERSR